MEKSEKKKISFPSSKEFRAELERTKEKERRRLLFRSRLCILITAAAAAILTATLILPVFRIYGSSMMPTLWEGDIVVAVKGGDPQRGDLLAFYYNNKILVKRVIALEGEWVNMDGEGNVYVNDRILEEPYLTSKSPGESDVVFPYQVPAGRVFVLGDNRATSADSRMEAMGSVAEEQIAGRLVLRIWPLGRNLMLDRS